MQKFKVKGQFVQKTDWKQTDGHDRLHYLLAKVKVKSLYDSLP